MYISQKVYKLPLSQKVPKRPVDGIGSCPLTWRIPETGVTPKSSMFFWDFPSIKNYPDIVVLPWLWKPPIFSAPSEAEKLFRCLQIGLQTQLAQAVHLCQVPRQVSLNMVYILERDISQGQWFRAFLKMEVPLYRWMVFVRENLSSKWMITGGTTLFHEISGNQFSDEAIKRCDETNKCSLANKDSVISWGKNRDILWNTRKKYVIEYHTMES